MGEPYFEYAGDFRHRAYVSNDVNNESDCQDEMLPQAVELVIETDQASTSLLQRRLKLGYARAAHIIDQMEQKGIVGPFEGAKPRVVLMTKAQLMEKKLAGDGGSSSEVWVAQGLCRYCGGKS